MVGGKDTQSTSVLPCGVGGGGGGDRVWSPQSAGYEVREVELLLPSLSPAKQDKPDRLMHLNFPHELAFPSKGKGEGGAHLSARLLSLSHIRMSLVSVSVTVGLRLPSENTRMHYQ